MWKTIEDNPMYEINELGEIRHKIRKKILKQQEKNRYMYISLGSKENKKTYAVHRLVAKAFLPRIEGKDIVNHKDYNTHNNCVDNLEWCTREENDSHRWNTEHGEEQKEKCRQRINKMIDMHKKAVICMDLEGNVVAEYESMSEAERQTGVNRKSIRYCIRGERQSAGGFLWRSSEDINSSKDSDILEGSTTIENDPTCSSVE